MTVMKISLFTGAFFAVCLLASFVILYGGPEEEQVDYGVYEYASAEEIDFYVRMEERVRKFGTDETKKQFKKFIGKKVNFYDELSVFWDMQEDKSTVAEIQKKESEGYMGDYDNQRFLRREFNGERYYIFETRHHTCVVPERLRWSVAQVRKTNQIKNEPRLLMIWGEVKRVPFYGEISDTYRASEYGVESEKIFVVCDKITRPNEEHFGEWIEKRAGERSK